MYLGCVVCNNYGLSQGVVQWIGPGPWHGFAQHEYLVLSIPVQTDEDSDLQVAADPCLALWL